MRYSKVRKQDVRFWTVQCRGDDLLLASGAVNTSAAATS